MIIPAFDLIRGRVVRLRQGDYARRETFALDPLAAVLGAAAQGATYLHLVDLDGAAAPTARQQALIAALVKASPVPIETGGGIRAADDVRRLLNLGVDRVVVGSTAVLRPELVRGWWRIFGPERLTLALDVRLRDGRAYVAAHGWRHQTAVTLERALRPFLPYGLKYLLVTDIGRDGMLSGPNVALYRDLTRRFPQVRLIASGGIAALPDLRAVRRAGAAAVVVGRALLTGKFTVAEAVRCWQNA